MTVHDDLATLRETLDRYANHERSASFHVALDRVEAEIARLERERDGLQGDVQFQYERRKGAEAEFARLIERIAYLESDAALVAADAEVARLRDGLRDFATHGTRFDTNPTVTWPTSEIHFWWVKRATEMDKAVRDRARALLAEDGAA